MPLILVFGRWRPADPCEFEHSLVSTVHYLVARATEWDSALKETKTQKPEAVALICNSIAPMGRWGTETGRDKGDPCLNEAEADEWLLKIAFWPLQVPARTRTHHKYAVINKDVLLKYFL